MTAGACGQFIASPTDLVKVRMQTEGLKKLKGEPVTLVIIAPLPTPPPSPLTANHSTVSWLFVNSILVHRSNQVIGFCGEEQHVLVFIKVVQF